MEYQIILPEPIGDEWQNIGIDFAPQAITGNVRGEEGDRTIISLIKMKLTLHCFNSLFLQIVRLNGFYLQNL
jgi:hypothetical protein